MTIRLSGMAARPSVLCALQLAAVLVCSAERAAAHDPPSGTGVYARGDQLVVRTQRGLIVSSSRERRDFRLLCNEALGVAEFDAASVLLQDDGSMLVGTSTGLVQVSPDLCAIDAMQAFGGARVSALLRASNASPDVYAATDAGFFASLDDAQTFTLQDANVFDSLALAADSAVYASGRYPGPRAQRRVYIARWHQGAALEQRELALEATEVGVALLGTDPRRAERVFAVAHAYLGTQDLDRLLISNDGAHTWTSPLSAASIGAFAIEPSTGAWLVGAATGLWRAEEDEPPRRVRDAAVSCLAALPAGLYVCDGMGSEGGLSLSADGGASWSSVFRFDQVAGLAECPMESKAVQPCLTAWADWTREMPLASAQLGPAPRDAGAGETDAAAPGDAGLARDAGTAAEPTGHVEPERTHVDAPSTQPSRLPGSRSSSICAAVSGIRSDNIAPRWLWLLLLAAALRKRRHRISYQRKQL